MDRNRHVIVEDSRTLKADSAGYLILADARTVLITVAESSSGYIIIEDGRAS
jgi:hypothetical protein